MGIELWNERWVLVGFLALLGCPSGDDAGAGTEGDTEASTGTTASTAATAPTTASSMSSTSASTGSSTTDSTGSEVTGEPSTGTSEPGDSSSGEGSSGTTGRVDACADLGREECQTTETCMPIVCSAFEMSNAGAVEWCLGEAQFIGCRSADLECAMEPTAMCEGDDAPVYLCREDCLPQGFMLCDPPADGKVVSCT